MFRRLPTSGQRPPSSSFPKSPAPSVHSCSMIGPVNRLGRAKEAGNGLLPGVRRTPEVTEGCGVGAQRWCCSGSKGSFRSLGLVLGLEPLLRMGWRQTSQSTHLPPPPLCLCCPLLSRVLSTVHRRRHSLDPHSFPHTLIFKSLRPFRAGQVWCPVTHTSEQLSLFPRALPC